MKHFIRKLRSTLKILFTLGMARTFGTYVHSGWNGDFDYARYHWCGKDFAIPTTPFEQVYHANQD